jgi:hypothetical protein
MAILSGVSSHLAQHSSRWSRRDLVFAGAGLLLLTFALYWRTLSTDYVYDDWLVLDEIYWKGALSTLLHHFDPRSLLTFRPIAWVYFVGVVRISGLAPLTFHLLALSLHAFNGVLVGWIATRISGNKGVGIAAGALFISLLSIHLDCLLWLVGFYDLGAMAFALLSIVSFLKGNQKSSAALMGCSLLTKEAAAFLPVVLFLDTLLTGRRIRDLGYHLIVVATYAGMKILGASPFSIGRENAHAMAVSWSLLTQRLAEYFTWLAEALLPLTGSSGSVIGGGIALLGLICVWLITRKETRGFVHSRRMLFLLGWFVLALAPVLLLKNQSARYYAIHASVPMAIILSSMAHEIAGRFGKKGGVLVAIVLAIVAVTNAMFVRVMFVKGIEQLNINDGYFHLVKRAAVVEALHQSLKTRYPVLPHGSVVIVEGLPLDAVGEGRAIRLWYGDSTLRMTTSMFQLEPDSSGRTDVRDKTVYLRLREVFPPQTD